MPETREITGIAGNKERIQCLSCAIDKGEVERRGEHSSFSTSKNLTNPVWCPLFENARTFFERKIRDIP